MVYILCTFIRLPPPLLQGAPSAFITQKRCGFKAFCHAYDAIFFFFTFTLFYCFPLHLHWLFFSRAAPPPIVFCKIYTPAWKWNEWPKTSVIYIFFLYTRTAPNAPVLPNVPEWSVPSDIQPVPSHLSPKRIMKTTSELFFRIVFSQGNIASF